MGSDRHLRNKRQAYAILAELAAAPAPQIASVLKRAYHHDADWFGSHPLNERHGIAAIEDVWLGMCQAFPDMERRDSLLVGGAYEGSDMVATMGHYQADYPNEINRKFVADWKKAYGANTTPDMLAVGGYDGMAAIYHVVRTVKGKITGGKAMAALKGWKHDSPRGPIMIDAETRDIIQNEHVHVVVKEEGRLVIKINEKFEAVKDQCKALRIGKCGKKLY